MRILVLQLARLGDIYQTWPTLSALRRQHPEAEISLLVRERFAGATEGLERLNIRIWTLPAAEILAPILTATDEVTSHHRLLEFLSPLIAAEFDRVINLSFSPSSSYLVDLVARPGASVSGYTRHSDGFLAIPDDSSAYFYAQVGNGRSNRYHLIDVFSAVAGVELSDEDLRWASLPRRDRVIIHLGASQVEKTYPPEQWVRVIRDLVARYDGEIVLIGSAEERAMANEVARQVAHPRLDNRVGQTKLGDLFKIIGEACLVVGADSAPIHLSTLLQTPVLNLSSGQVRFWETGPLTPGSRVLFAPTMNGIAPMRVVEECLALLANQPPVGAVYEVEGRSYRPIGIPPNASDDFRWHLIEALYTGTPYPAVIDNASAIAFQRLFELAELALFHLAVWPVAKTSVELLSQIDGLFEEIPRLNADVVPVLQWFQTQRLRQAPADPHTTWSESRRLFEELLWVTSVYRAQNATGSENRAVQLCNHCAPLLREEGFQSVEGEFHVLIACLQDLARHSTKVGGRAWSSVLGSLNKALERRDWIEIADQLEYELKPELEKHASAV